MILAIDQGTSSTKGAVLDPDGRLVAQQSVAISQAHPRPGWVEQDAEEILASVRTVLAGLGDPHPVEAVALSTQRESAIVWDRATRKPIGPMLGWQDRRTAPAAARLADHAARVRSLSGLQLDPMFSALKFAWLLDQVDPDRTRAGRGDLVVGTVDSWLVHNLTGEHRIEIGNASRTQLLDVSTGAWSEELCDLFRIPSAALPQVVGSDVATPEVDGMGGRRVTAVLGDSHAALYGHGVRTAGEVKATYGTGSSVMTLLDDAGAPGGLVETIAWSTGGTIVRAAEGNILSSGATVAWVARLLGTSVDEVTRLARGASAGNVVLVPAMAGLGAPHWDPDARAVLVGFDLGTDASTLARAAVESIAHQITDVVSAIAATLPVRSIRADGAPAADDSLMQLQADTAGIPVVRPSATGLSARGAADLAANTAGHPFPPLDAQLFEPGDPSDEQRARWADAVALSTRSSRVTSAS